MNELAFKNYQKRFNLHYLAADKFKTNLVQIYFMLPLRSEKEAALNALIPAVLRRGSKNYPNNRLIKTELENLYGANLAFNILKRGENQILRFSLEIVNEKFLTQKSNLTQNAFALLNDLLFNPLVENNSFREKYFEQEKRILKEEILALINDKASYALEQSIKKMCEKEKYSIYKLGSIAVLEKLKKEELYLHYQNLLKEAKRSLFLVGNFKKEFLDGIDNKTKLAAGKDIYDEDTEIIHQDKKIDFYQDELNINQAKLSIGFRTGISRKMTSYYALLVFNSLIGGSTHSKLFQEIREKRSLAYYIRSSIESTKALLFINSGINAEDQQQVVKLVKKEIKAVASGDFSRDEFRRSKKSIINRLKQDLDSSKALAAHYLLSLVNNKQESLKEVIAGVEAVKAEAVAAAAENLILDTVYLLRSEA